MPRVVCAWQRAAVDSTVPRRGCLVGLDPRARAGCKYCAASRAARYGQVFDADDSNDILFGEMLEVLVRNKQDREVGHAL